MESFFSTVKIELADRFASLSEAKMELFDYIEVFTTNGAGIRRSARSVRRPSNDAQRPRHVHRGALGGQLLPSNGQRRARHQAPVDFLRASSETYSTNP
jgi:hypothetical protein